MQHWLQSTLVCIPSSSDPFSPPAPQPPLQPLPQKRQAQHQHEHRHSREQRRPPDAGGHRGEGLLQITPPLRDGLGQAETEETQPPSTSTASAALRVSSTGTEVITLRNRYLRRIHSGPAPRSGPPR